MGSRSEHKGDKGMVDEVLCCSFYNHLHQPSAILSCRRLQFQTVMKKVTRLYCFNLEAGQALKDHT